MSKQHKEEIARLNGQVADVEKERDFYLDKLREIEILCQQDDDVESGKIYSLHYYLLFYHSSIPSSPFLAVLFAYMHKYCSN